MSIIDEIMVAATLYGCVIEDYGIWRAAQLYGGDRKRSVVWDTQRDELLLVASRLLAGRLAVARKLAVILHCIWTDGTEFQWGKANA